jgi:hypothetical protein
MNIRNILFSLLAMSAGLTNSVAVAGGASFEEVSAVVEGTAKIGIAFGTIGAGSAVGATAGGVGLGIAIGMQKGVLMGVGGALIGGTAGAVLGGLITYAAVVKYFRKPAEDNDSKKKY